MAIEIQHQPSAGALAGPGFAAGNEERRRYENDLAMKMAEMAQRERMQANSIAAQQASQLMDINARFAGNVIDHNQRMQIQGLQNQFNANQQAAQNKFNVDQQAAQNKAIDDRMKADDERRVQAQIDAEKRAIAEQLRQEQLLQQRTGQAFSAFAPTNQYQAYLNERSRNEESFDYTPTQRRTIDSVQEQRDIVQGLMTRGQIGIDDGQRRLRELEQQEMAIMPTVKRTTPQQDFESSMAVDPTTGQPYVRGGWKPGAKQPQEVPFEKREEASRLYSDALKSAPDGHPNPGVYAQSQVEARRLSQLGAWGWAQSDPEGQVVAMQALQDAQDRGMNQQQAELYVRRSIVESFNSKMDEINNRAMGGSSQPAQQQTSPPPQQPSAPSPVPPPQQPQSPLPAQQQVAPPPTPVQPSEPLPELTEKQATSIVRAQEAQERAIKSGFTPATQEESAKMPGLLGMYGDTPVFESPSAAKAVLGENTNYYGPKGPEGEMYQTPSGHTPTGRQLGSGPGTWRGSSAPQPKTEAWRGKPNEHVWKDGAVDLTSHSRFQEKIDLENRLPQRRLLTPEELYFDHMDGKLAQGDILTTGEDTYMVQKNGFLKPLPIPQSRPESETQMIDLSLGSGEVKLQSRRPGFINAEGIDDLSRLHGEGKLAEGDIIVTPFNTFVVLGDGKLRPAVSADIVNQQ